MLEATDPTTFADGVLALLDAFTEQGLRQSHHARDGRPWPWPDSRSTDWIYLLNLRSRVGDHRPHPELRDAAS